jgi:catechol 2,3-dioxygenase-like lactoylglutathione lyase family enzyme
MSAIKGEVPLRFHISLNVSDLAAAVAFYRVLFGMEATKCHDDYAKFDLHDPPVVFSLAPHAPGSGGSLSHLSLRVPDGEALDAVRQRLEAAGLPCQCQHGTVCGYARQNKVWVEDPDRNFWEIYVIEAEVDPASIRRSIDGAALARPQSVAAPVVWEHYVSATPPERIPHADASLDEVRLTGTFNAAIEEKQLRNLLAETWRVLKPGGKVVSHGLMGDRPFGSAKPSLPGLASLVARVPVHTEPLALLRAAGFVGLHYVKFTAAPWFVVDGVEMREIKLLGRKPEIGSGEHERQVIYKGPFRQATDELGNVFRRGERTTLTAVAWESLRNGSASEQFLFLEPETAASCGCG